MTLDHADELVAAPSSPGAARPARRETWWRVLRRDRFAFTGLLVVVGYVVVALTAPLFLGWLGVDPYTYHLDALDENGAPAGWGGGISAEHWFGVEPLTGRDLFAIVVMGSRASLAVGLGATAVAVLVGATLGVLAGYAGGWVDVLVSRIVDVLLGFPALVFMIALGAIIPLRFPHSPRILILVLVIGLFGWTSIARVVRAQSLTLRSLGFVRASRGLGAGSGHIVLRHVLPNLAATVVVFATISVPGAIGSEAALSFLGVGVQPPTPSWGRSIGDAVTWFSSDPMYLVFPGLALFGITLAFNAFGDGLRDALDPRAVRR
ncbi:ABC transporter permease [Cellulomonas alba]|uniref:ABC transporter permease n=1 Tax=Cellulomonas alba TaxID=3053467 RepID=A0ABT7SCA7_9CELL|nr:ABC transporter permease [Cellulomonas alba]MDM7853826.1 ABC transporter permease [Cellulomonas alba]